MTTTIPTLWFKKKKKQTTTVFHLTFSILTVVNRAQNTRLVKFQ